MIESKLKSDAVDKVQPPKQLPLIIKQSIPSKSEIGNMNQGSIILDEVNGILHIKGYTKTWKFAGVAE